jgi:hypothetical protein
VRIAPVGGTGMKAATVKHRRRAHRRPQIRQRRLPSLPAPSLAARGRDRLLLTSKLHLHHHRHTNGETMTTNETDLTPEQMDAALESAQEILRRRVAELEHAKALQPERLTRARTDAEEARDWAILEEPWKSQITAVPMYNCDGNRAGDALTIPNLTAKELWGSRLCFDLLDCGDDEDRIDEVRNHYFSTLNGDTGALFLIFAAALTTAASLVVPQLLDEIEQQGSNYDARVMLAEARAKAWNGRVAELRGPQDDAADCGVRPIDAFDIAANAIDEDGGEPS